MMTVQTIGSVDSKRKLPAPRQYVIVSTLWGILFLLADGGLGRLAARLSLLTLLTASVLGPFGASFVSFLNTITRQFGLLSPAVGPAASSPSAPGGGVVPFTPGHAQPAPSARPVRPTVI